MLDFNHVVEVGLNNCSLKSSTHVSQRNNGMCLGLGAQTMRTRCRAKVKVCC